MCKIRLSNNAIVPIKIITIIIEVFLLIIILINCFDNSDNTFLLAGIIWFCIIGIISVPILVSKTIFFDREKLFIENTFRKRTKIIKLESIIFIKTSFFGYFTFIKYHDLEMHKVIVVTINTFETSIEHNTYDFLGINKKLFNSKKYDKIRLLKNSSNY